MSNNKMVFILEYYLTLITIVIDVAVGLVIGISAVWAFASFLKHLTMKNDDLTVYWVTIRTRLARGLLLALDFEIGSDILKTILVPSFTELIILGVVVAIRIILSWSLSKEIEGRRDDVAKTKRLPDTR
ncbi:MAG TPA: DUF1622 domain-containing protein [Nitrososphaeraceae archaeon]|jgi:uncharacterized membrane protein